MTATQPTLMRLPHRRDLALFAFGMALAFITRGIALFAPSYAVDDIIMMQFPFDAATTGYSGFREGRFIYPLVAEAAHQLGVHLPRAYTMSAVWLMACLSATAVLVCHLWGIAKDIKLSALVVAVLVLHPYQADIYTWKIALFVGGLPFVLAVLSVNLAGDSWKRVWLGAAVLWFALGGHQLGLAYASAAAALTMLLASARIAVGQPAQSLDLERLARYLAVLVVGTAVYWLTSILVMRMLDVGSLLGREQIILLSQPGLVWKRTVELGRMMLFADPLMSPVQRYLLWLIAGIGAVAMGLAARRRHLLPRLPLLLAVSGGAVLAAWVFSVALTVTPRVWIPFVRNMGSVAVVVAGIVAAAYLLTEGLWRKLVVGLAVLLCFGYAGKSNEILTDQLRANQRERALVWRVAGDIEKLPAFATLTRLAIVGKTPVTLRNLATAADPGQRDSYGVTLSVLANPAFDNTYPVLLLNELTGYAFGPVLTAEDSRAADDHCRAAPLWPAAGSVVSLGTMGVVCIGRPTERRASKFE